MATKQIYFIMLVLFAGACHQASAARQLTAAVSPATSYTWLPHKNADNVWQPAQTEGVDYAKLTLQDLPPPEVFVQMAMQSPYPMPDIPMGLLINNTFNQWAGGKPPSSVTDWLQMMQGAGSFVAESVPALMAKLPNITLEGKSVSVAAETSKLLKSLPFFNNSTSMALPLPEGMVGVGVAAPIINITQGVNMTIDILQKLPEMLKQAGQAVVDGVQSLDLSSIEDALTNDDGQLDIPKIIKSTLNIDVPQFQPPNVTQVLAQVAKSLPVVAQQMGVDPSTVKFPDTSALEGLLKLTNSKDLLITDGLGRVDLLATIAQLPQRLPELNDVASAVTKALPAPPQGMPSLDQVVSKVVDVTKAVASAAAKLQ